MRCAQYVHPSVSAKVWETALKLEAHFYAPLRSSSSSQDRAVVGNESWVRACVCVCRYPYERV